ncbi:MAG: PIG-L family deacetylase [Candidatus Woesearchaeota archaeon]|nr:PIG-L family deacetylase [Candidatus Woesearchaeota archaeon]
MEKRKKVIAISAHPDDLEIGASFAVMNYVREGYEVYSILVTDGDKGGDSAVRIREAEEAAKVLGIKDIFRLKCPDTNLPKESKLIEKLESFYYKYLPEVVITHTTKERHKDHVQVSNASRIAFRKSSTIIMFRSVSGLVEFSPHLFYVGDKDDLENKIRACSCHKTQVEKGILDLEVIQANAIFWGNVYNPYEKKYAEPFEINHYGMILKKQGGRLI